MQYSDSSYSVFCNIPTFQKSTDVKVRRRLQSASATSMLIVPPTSHSTLGDHAPFRWQLHRVVPGTRALLSLARATTICRDVMMTLFEANI